MFARLGAVVLFTPTFVLPALVIAAIGGWLGQVYIKAQLSVKREMSTAKAPVLGILGGAIAGLRAYIQLAPLAVFSRFLHSVHQSLPCTRSLQEGNRETH